MNDTMTTDSENAPVVGPPQPEVIRPEVGKTYRDEYGTVRWIHKKSQRGYYHMRWLTDSGEWHSGGQMKAARWVKGPRQIEIPGPQPGDEVVILGPMGNPARYKLESDGSMTMLF